VVQESHCRLGYQGGYRIELTFDDGRSGVVDFSQYLDRGGVFARFRDLEYFCSFRVNHELGTLTWGDEIDIAPERLYSLTRRPCWTTFALLFVLRSALGGLFERGSSAGPAEAVRSVRHRVLTGV